MAPGDRIAFRVHVTRFLEFTLPVDEGWESGSRPVVSDTTFPPAAVPEAPASRK